MTVTPLRLALTALLLAPIVSNATTRYVDVNSTNPVPPYTNWATAANVIQDAVDAADAGDTVLVTNGVYATGGKAVYGLMTNRVAVDKPLTLVSVNGPERTVIVGQAAPGGGNGDGAVRCVYVGTNVVLSGFTLTNGHTRTSGDATWTQSGGGVWCEASGVLTNCVLTGNSADERGGGACGGTLSHCVVTGNSALTGGGAYSGTLNHCTLKRNWARHSGGGASDAALKGCWLSDNSADYGGGARQGTFDNCTISGNSALSGGGVRGGTLNNCTITGNWAEQEGGGVTGNPREPCYLENCILYYNVSLGSGDNYDSSTLDYCCTTPLPESGTGNIDSEPQLASASHLSATSPCRAAGSSAFVTGTDLDGEAWGSPPSIGCDEYWSGSVTGAVSVDIQASSTRVALGYPVDFRALIEGRVSASNWDFGDGVTVSNRTITSHTWASVGDFSVELRAYNETHPDGVTATVTVHVMEQPVHYVAMSSTNPVPPYTNWATAARVIQEAVDVAAVGGRVWVSNGVYATGGRAVAYSMTNRVAVTKQLRVQSVNGPGVTAIVGEAAPSGGNGDGAIRCVYVGTNAVLSGFTLINGHTRSSGRTKEISGGGAWCEMSGVLTNCVVAGNSANYGGGAYNGTLINCLLMGNSAVSGGGVSGGTLNHCTLTGNSAGYGGGSTHGTLNRCTLTGNSASYGGGSYRGTLNSCTLTGNSARYRGGGSCYATLNSCILTVNSAGESGGGAYSGTLNHCTLTGNSAEKGGGAYSATANNCIVYYNTAPSYPNFYSGTLQYCCATPLPSSGVGNFTNEPQFVDANGWADLRLQSNSACINAGNNAYVTSATDLDGNPRIVGGTVDLGAYESTEGSTISGVPWSWLLQYGLPTDSSADNSDSDSDSLTAWQEWKAWTDPTNGLSVLRLLSPQFETNGTVVRWESVAGQSYLLERAFDLGAPFTLLQSNVTGQTGTTSFTDTNAIGDGPFLYRVGVE